MFQRAYLQQLKKRINEPRRFLQVVTGPRQVGKTTLLLQLMKSETIPVHYCTADGIGSHENNWISSQWEVARMKIHQNPESKATLLIFDEIQKIDNWSEAVKKEWDADSRFGIPIKVILSGSSRLLIQKGLTESLAGRFELIYMGHWSYHEMHQAFGWDEDTFAWYGGYPGSAALISEEDRWKRYISDSIIESSIFRDIVMLTRIDKPALLRRLFGLGSLYSGQILSFTKMLGQLQDTGNTVTLSHYLSLLDQAGLLAGLEKFGTHFRQRASSPKFQVYNTALFSAQQPQTLQQAQADHAHWGRIVESAIGAHLINSTKENGLALFYWRERNREVDFILEKEGKTIAIEVKSGQIGKLSGMVFFSNRYKPLRQILIAPQAFDWKEFLRIDPASLF